MQEVAGVVGGGLEASTGGLGPESAQLGRAIAQGLGHSLRVIWDQAIILAGVDDEGGVEAAGGTAHEERILEVVADVNRDAVRVLGAHGRVSLRYGWSLGAAAARAGEV